MKRTFSILWLFSRYAVKSSFQQRTGVVFFLVGKILRFGLFFFFVMHLLNNTKLLAGYDLNQTVVFFMTFNIVDTLSQLLFREVYRFRAMVVRGELDTVLVKPYHPFLRVLLGGIDVLDLIMMVPYVAILVWFAAKSGVHVYAGSYILMLFCSLMISAAFHIAVLGLGVVTTEVDHSIMIFRDMTRLGTFPIDIYREPVRSVFTFVIPIGIMMSFPPKALFGLLSMQFIIMSIVFAVLGLWLSVSFWNRALRYYQSGSS